ncbi:hypothetical protein VKT23_006284 [Stygiomarasmius scandens]|uniref:Uncharacterized protein n=1 Tax=Marasmiellus scandens TaxID=2682957 RepID=A0ABR1JQ70_9AGAR
MQGGYFRRELMKASVQGSTDLDSRRRYSSTLGEEDWVCASGRVQRLLKLQGFGPRLFGLTDEGTGVEMDQSASTHLAGLCIGKLEKPIPWSQTLTASQVPSGSVPDQTSVQRPEAIILKNGDRCKRNSWVVWKCWLHDKMPAALSLGQITELIQFRGGGGASSGCADVVTVRRALRGETHDTYHMPQPELLNEYFVVKPAELDCVVNVQHNCHDHKCPITRSRVVWREREDSNEKMSQVSHISPQEVILNTAQMRSAASIRPFRRNAPVENRDVVVTDAVWAEVANRKKAAQTRPEPAVPNPNPPPFPPSFSVSHAQPSVASLPLVYERHYGALQMSYNQPPYNRAFRPSPLAGPIHGVGRFISSGSFDTSLQTHLHHTFSQSSYNNDTHI